VSATLLTLLLIDPQTEKGVYTCPLPVSYRGHEEG